MKLSKTPAALSVLAVLLAGAAVLAYRPAPVVADDDHDPGHELHEAMEEMDGLYRQVRRHGRNAEKNAETIENLHQLAAVALAAKAHLPAMVGEMPAEQQAELTATYRKMMNDLVVHLLAAENALLDGDNAAAWDAILAANSVKGDGHELFLPDDE